MTLAKLSQAPARSTAGCPTLPRMMTTELATGILAHVRAAEELLVPFRHTAFAGKRWRRALVALTEARHELEHGLQVLKGEGAVLERRVARM